MAGRTNTPWLLHPSLVPESRYLVFLVVGLTVANAITGLLYCVSFRLARDFGATDGIIAAFDLDAEGSLNAWLNSSLLLVGGGVAMAICRVKSVRGAGTRELFWWGWTAALLFVMSADEGGSLHEGFKELCVRLFGTRLVGDGSVFWAVPYSVAVGVTYAAAFHYLRGRPVDRFLILLSAIAFASAAALQLELLLPTEDPLEILAEELLEVQGSTFLVGALSSHLLAALRTGTSIAGVTRGSGSVQVRVVSVGTAPAVTAARRLTPNCEPAYPTRAADRAA